MLGPQPESGLNFAAGAQTRASRRDFPCRVNVAPMRVGACAPWLPWDTRGSSRIAARSTLPDLQSWALPRRGRSHVDISTRISGVIRRVARNGSRRLAECHRESATPGQATNRLTAGIRDGNGRRAESIIGHFCGSGKAHAGADERRASHAGCRQLARQHGAPVRAAYGSAQRRSPTRARAVLLLESGAARAESNTPGGSVRRQRAGPRSLAGQRRRYRLCAALEARSLGA